MRITIHTVSAGDYPLFAQATRAARRQLWLRSHHEFGDLEMEKVAEAIRRHLRAGPRRQAELVELLQTDGFPRAAWSGAGLWVDLVRVPPSGTWERRRADLYGLAEDWLGRSEVGETEGMEHLVRRYLAAFGPASMKDISSWAGLPVTTLRPLLDRLELRQFRAEDGGVLLDVPGGPLPNPSAPVPARFLPVFDATLLVHARRTQILPERYRSLVFNTKTPHSVNTFLVDGSVAGAWRCDKGRVVLEPFERLPKAVSRELERESEQLAALHSPLG